MIRSAPVTSALVCVGVGAAIGLAVSRRSPTSLRALAGTNDRERWLPRLQAQGRLVPKAVADRAQIMTDQLTDVAVNGVDADGVDRLGSSAAEMLGSINSALTPLARFLQR